MKFLLTIRELPGGSTPADAKKLNRDVRAWVGEHLKSGTFECAYYMLPKAGIAIVDIDSHEALLSLMRNWPAYEYSAFEVCPLADVGHGIDSNYDRIKAVEAQS